MPDDIPAGHPFLTAPILKRVTRILPVPLTPEELAARGQRMARILELVNELEAELEQFKRGTKEAIGSHEIELTTVARQVRLGTEEREVAVRIVAHEMQAVEIREDTEAVILRRPLEEHERQTLIPNIEKT